MGSWLGLETGLGKICAFKLGEGEGADVRGMP